MSVIKLYSDKNCAYHELGHLLVGHCQLCENMRFAAVDTEEERAGLDIPVYQALEMDADLFAGRRVAERAASMIVNGSMGHFGYDDYNLFYFDTLRENQEIRINLWKFFIQRSIYIIC